MKSSPAPKQLVWITTFEFISPLPLEVCLERLQQEKTHPVLFSGRYIPYLSDLEQNRVLFHVREYVIRDLDGLVIGTAEAITDQNTKIYGKIGFTRGFIDIQLPLFIGGFLALSLYGFFSMENHWHFLLAFIFGLSYGCIFLAFIYDRIEKKRERLIRYLHETFEYSDPNTDSL